MKRVSVNSKNEGQHKKTGLKQQEKEIKSQGLKGLKGRQHKGQQTDRITHKVFYKNLFPVGVSQTSWRATLRARGN